jgi:hypothetical protein
MPFGRYFVFVGSFLLSLLYLLNWYVPQLAAEPAHFEIDRSIIRIHSQHQWPKAVAIDTNIKTINAPPRDDFPALPVEPNRPNNQSQQEPFESTSRIPHSTPKLSKPTHAASRPAKSSTRAIRSQVVGEQIQPVRFKEW